MGVMPPCGVGPVTSTGIFFSSGKDSAQVQPSLWQVTPGLQLERRDYL